MSSVSLSEPIARRLFHDGSDWCLELEAWRAIDRDVFSPTKQILKAPDLIARTLLDMPAYRDLVPKVKALMADSPAKRGSYLIKPGELSPEPAYSAEAASREKASVSERPRPSERPNPDRSSYVPSAVQHSLADMKNELELLRARVHELEDLTARFDPHYSPTSNNNALAHEEVALDGT